MPPARIRKLFTIVQPLVGRHDVGRRAAALAVIENPCCLSPDAALEALGAIGDELTGLLGQYAATALGLAPRDLRCYGKAAIVGAAGDLEHATAVLHPQLLGPARSWRAAHAELVPSARKLGGQGTSIEVPLGRRQRNPFAQRFEAIAVRVADAPRPHEIVLAVAIADQPPAPPRAAGDNVVSLFGAR
ncbi:MAG: amino acid synthesis family protein [Gammaproteobacteria bacterium]|jgi:hypothetical protein|nr:amino acid synthesis family protein [Gammaproteobacteria bacterium]